MTSTGGTVSPIAPRARGWRLYLPQLLAMSGAALHPQQKFRVFSHSRKERNQCRKACECRVRNLPVKVPSLWREVDRAKGKIGGGLGCRRAAPRRQGEKDAEFLRKRQSGTVSS